MKTQYGQFSLSVTELLDIIRMLSSKVYHDMANPINATHCALEMLSKPEFVADENQQKMALSIATDSGVDSVNCIIFLRTAYSFSTIEKKETISEYIEEIRNFIKRRKISLEITQDENITINTKIKQIIYNMILSIQEVTSSITSINISIEDMGENITLSFDVNSTSTPLIVRENCVDALLGDCVENKPKTEVIQQYFTALLIRELEGNISISQKEGSFTFAISIKKENIKINYQ